MGKSQSGGRGSARSSRKKIGRETRGVIDKSNRKKGDDASQDSEELFRLLVEGAKDYAMFLLDPGNVITFWSAGAERVFGWSREEAEGRKGDLIFTPKDKANGAVEMEINTALREGRALDRRWHLRKDGTRIWTDGLMTRLDAGDGNVRGLAKIARDATKQRHAEEAVQHARDQMEQQVVERTADLLATNRQLERTMAQREQLERQLLEISEHEKRRIGEDLHDLLCQDLTATALFLKSGATRVAKKSPEAARLLEESAQTVNRNVGVARDLARGLHPADFSAAELIEALQALATQACEFHGIHCEFSSTGRVRVRDDGAALQIYRIAQEALNNAVKHSGGKNIVISIEQKGEQICLTVADDGKGFLKRRRSKGLGIHLMHYRTKLLGGNLKVETGKRGGTIVRVCIPIRARLRNAQQPTTSSGRTPSPASPSES